MNDTYTVEVVVRLTLKTDGYETPTDVVNEMDYRFKHQSIVDYELIDIQNEN